MSARTKYLWLAIATLATSALAITNQSFWIDEGGAAMKAVQPTVAAWWDALRVEGHSDLQLLPHIFLLWVWEKIFGSSEVALRAANIPLLFAGLAAALWGLRSRPSLQFWFCLAALVNAFTWYYLSEARPYILLFTGACVVLACLYRTPDLSTGEVGKRAWFAALIAGLFLLCATSLIAVPWAMAWFASAITLAGYRRFVEVVWHNITIALAFFAGMAGLGAYYLWTLSLGARASFGTTGLANLVFIVFEQTGLSGLGPGRNQLRGEGLRSLSQYGIPLFCGLLAVAMTVLEGLREIAAARPNKKVLVASLLAILAPLALVLLAGNLMQVRILGRHFTPLYPIVLFLLAAGLRRLWHTRKAVAVAVVLVLLTSSLQVRFASRHTRDDYRSAASVARDAIARGEQVWWAANDVTGLYYKLPVVKPPQAGNPIALMNPAASSLAELPQADVIVLSKRDIYDSTGVLDKFLKTRGYQQTQRFQSFEIFARRPSLPRS